jgi:hypothetical protein
MANQPTPYNTGLRDIVGALVIKLARQLSAQSPNQYEQSLSLQQAPQDSAPSKIVPWDLLSALASQTARDRAEPTPEARVFKEIAQRFPTIFAPSSPQTTDMGVQSQEREAIAVLLQCLAAWLTRRGGTSPGSEPAERPHEQMASQR